MLVYYGVVVDTFIRKDNITISPSNRRIKGRNCRDRSKSVREEDVKSKLIKNSLYVFNGYQYYYLFNLVRGRGPLREEKIDTTALRNQTGRRRPVGILQSAMTELTLGLLKTPGMQSIHMQCTCINGQRSRATGPKERLNEVQLSITIPTLIDS